MAPATTARVTDYMVRIMIAGLAVAIGWTVAPAQAQSTDPATFDTPDAALKALQQALEKQDRDEMRRIFGSALEALKSGDEVQDRNDFEAFGQALAARSALDKNEDGTMTLQVGVDAYPFPIPLRQKDGTWYFDTQAGKEEIVNRRVGENELRTIAVCRTYVLAQREYFLTDWDGDLVLEYAQKLTSAIGQKDGLYWPTEPGERPSPFGPLVAQARAEGYGRQSVEQKPADGAQPGAAEAKPAPNATPEPTPNPAGITASRRPYFGYLYKILHGQNEPTPGGKYDYVVNGNMVAGFGLVAFPVNYGESGVMTFVVNASGIVWQKNLGESTADAVAAMDKCQIDDTWSIVTEETPWVANETTTPAAAEQ